VALAAVKAGSPGLIIPAFISGALPQWFGTVFMLTLLYVAITTLS
jgi:hypothetical protein